MKIANFNLESDGTFIVAELSANHGNDINIAKATIEAAKDVGADAIKLQTYTADTMTLDCARDDFFIKGGTLWDNKSLYQLYDEAHLPWQWHAELFAFARGIGIEIFSTPFDKSAVDFLKQFAPSAYKIASFEITDHDLIGHIATQGKPVIISTGIATYAEIQNAVDICRSAGNQDIVLLKCTSAYPAPIEDANLRTIPDLAETFGVIAGYSDHTIGTTASIAAVTLGAQVIEKHFILNKFVGGHDVDFSLDPAQFKEMVQVIRDTEKMLGTVDYSMSDRKKINRQFSRSLYVVADIEIGEIFSGKNIRAIRPGYGLHPKHLEEVLGKTSLKALKRGDRLDMNDVGGSSK